MVAACMSVKFMRTKGSGQQQAARRPKLARARSQIILIAAGCEIDRNRNRYFDRGWLCHDHDSYSQSKYVSGARSGAV